MSNIFPKGYWYKKFVSSDDPVEVVYEFVNSFIANHSRVKYDQLFSEFDAEAIRISESSRCVVSGMRLSCRWFRVMYVNLSMEAARMAGKENDKRNKIVQFFKERDIDALPFFDPVAESGEEISSLEYGDPSRKGTIVGKAVPLVLRHEILLGSMWVSGNGKEWIVDRVGDGKVFCVSRKDRKCTFSVEMFLKFKRV